MIVHSPRVIMIKVTVGVALVHAFILRSHVAEAYQPLNSPVVHQTSQRGRPSSGPSPLNAIEFRDPAWKGRKGVSRTNARVGLRATTTDADRTVQDGSTTGAEETTLANANFFGAPLEVSSSSNSSTRKRKGTDTPVTAASTMAINSVGEMGKNAVGPGKGVVMDKYPIESALQRIDRDMVLLDSIVANKAQLTVSEAFFLVSSVVVAATAPILLPLEPAKVLATTLAASSAAIGISAEYTGKSAFASSKVVAATTLEAAAEAETVLASAERVKAMIPLTVGTATASAVLSILTPVLLEELALKGLGDAIILFPIIAMLSASVAGIALQKCRTLCGRAIGIGNRRNFASSSSIGRNWLSATVQTGAKSLGISKRKQFAIGTIPALMIGMIFPGHLAHKAIVAAAIGVCQTAWYLAVAEYEIARATDAVALKTRSAAVAETYANQAMRGASILGFTSALSALCAAATAAVVEFLPLISAAELQALASGFFPAGAGLFAAAASVNKVSCQVDAAAANAAAEQIAFPEKSFSQNEDSNGNDGVLLPVKGVKELIRLTAASFYSSGSTITNYWIRRWRQRWSHSSPASGAA